ncbi:putative 50s ribosomal protein L4 [Schistosoma mansoni]|uniref:putative 50s ribosomal protein L4 n=1 Tax=Schistosoma mansoni TaxID=6183 RepID=UPI0001A63E00|nr:putative 50s ribosomal protein L4 [Schistosoma mansoni]|eukprot:XP_018647621.1 putative 50s ribosomal protein L4 [Schistosoma mansoni]
MGTYSINTFIKVKYGCDFFLKHNYNIILTRSASSRSFKIPEIDIKCDELQPEPSNQPIITSRKLQPPVYCSATSRGSRLTWLETLKPVGVSKSSNSQSLLGMIDLHPDIFAVFPRIDLVHKNLYWQAHYRLIDWRCITTRAELSYGTRKKPWPQKGTGKARHGNRRTHIWLTGGQCKGPRGPESFYYLLSYGERLAGLLSMLSIKHAQVIFVVVEKNNELSAIYIRQLADLRCWGPSILFVDAHSPASQLAVPCPGSENIDNNETDNMNFSYDNLAISLACGSYENHVKSEISPESSAFKLDSIAPRATHPGRGLTLMPVHSLNVWSMVHHDTLVISLKALEMLEERLIAAQTVVVRDEYNEAPYLHPSTPDWFTTEVDGQADDYVNKSFENRHFSDLIGSSKWRRDTL